VELELNRNYFSKLGIRFDIGLSDSEIGQVEDKYGFEFPPDLRDLLQFGLPINSGFINWRNDSEDEIRGRLDWLFEGIYFDVGHNSFWLEEWGEKPTNPKDALRIVKGHVDKAPKLIPIYSHRYIPDAPNEKGNPVFSVYQTDIIVYGEDLGTYLQNEFAGSQERNRIFSTGKAKYIDFWSKLVKFNNG